jgi:hypothetical protein
MFFNNTNYVNEKENGDWGLGIGANPHTPIPQPPIIIPILKK